MSLRVDPGRIGGPTGRHARRQGMFFDPAPWLILVATLVWALKMGHQSFCQQSQVDAPVKTMMRMCYSDVPIVWQSNGLGTGAAAAGGTIPQTPVVAAIIDIGRAITGLFTPVTPTASPQQVLDSGNVFMVVNAVVLSCFFLAWVIAHMVMGRGSTVGIARDATGRLTAAPRRSWDGAYIATSIGIFTCALLNWDLVAPALTALALMAWSTGRPVLAGVLTGLALGAGIAPAVLVVAITVLCVRAGLLDVLARYIIATGAALAAISVAALALNPESLRRSYLALLDPQVGYGSFWWILQEQGWTLGAEPALSKLLVAAAMGGVVLLAFQAPARPRVAQVAALLVLVGLVLAPTYSPQYVLWAVGFVALARPRLRDWALWSLTEALYWAAVWGHLQGNLRLGVNDDGAYPLAIIVRLLGAGWMIWKIADDMLHPWDDEVRVGMVDDPQGGPLDYAPDASWMKNPPPAVVARDETPEPGTQPVAPPSPSTSRR
ncbi:hypothetical protein ACQB6R_00300 [Propionibacteriaceae bacterium G1746]|uniref:hypothetical protein n=1 Tax=Aestuariimicrobium sp. G57 TaxID=3418485 RepID=UPI003C172470